MCVSKYPPLLFLHLSDLHFGLNRFPDDDLEHTGQVLGKCIYDKSQTLQVPLSLVFVTGDVANKALPKEYELALNFFKGLKKGLQVESEQFVFVPGNHDVSHATCQIATIEAEVRDTPQKVLLEKIERTKFDFFQNEFINLFQPSPLANRKVELLSNHGKLIHFPNLFLSVAALNSCEGVTHTQTDGSLQEKQMQALMKQWKTVDHTKVVLLHHNPTGAHEETIKQWRNSMNSKAEKAKFDLETFIADARGIEGKELLKSVAIDRQVSLILHGHQHAGYEDNFVKQGKSVTQLLAAGSLSVASTELPEDESNECQLLELNPERSKMTRWHYLYNPKLRIKGELKKGVFLPGWLDPNIEPTQGLNYPLPYSFTPTKVPTTPTPSTDFFLFSPGGHVAKTVFKLAQKGVHF